MVQMIISSQSTDLINETTALRSIVEKEIVVRCVTFRNGFDDFLCQNATSDRADRTKSSHAVATTEIVKRHYVNAVSWLP